MADDSEREDELATADESEAEERGAAHDLRIVQVSRSSPLQL